MTDNVDEHFVSDDGYSRVEKPVIAAGGEAKQSHTGADKKKKVNPKAEKIVQKSDGTAVNEDLEENTFASLFEGMDLSEDFKGKVSLVFEAAVSEATALKVQEVTESLEEQFETRLAESVTESMEEIVENLDSYLDYIVREWLEENELAIETSLKVDMAESFMEGLKGLFYEHNVSIDEETIDVVSELEEEISKSRTSAKNAINENIELQEEISALKAQLTFNEVCEGLTVSQAERLRTLAENLDYSDLDQFSENLSTLKESFFKKTPSAVELTEDHEEGEVLTEEAAPVRVSQYDDVNAIAFAMKALK